MSSEFDYSPSVKLLHGLVEGHNLKQLLPKAVRLWVILRSIYGSNNDEVKLELADKFTYLDWRNQFFKDAAGEHKRDKIPSLHNTDCRCAKNLENWLFESDLSRDKWIEYFLNLYVVKEKDLEIFLQKAVWPSPEEKNNKKEAPFPAGRIFACTGKNLQNDFKSLVKLGYLKENKKAKITKYLKVSELPQLEDETINKIDFGSFENQFISQSANIAYIAQEYFKPINEVQRFAIYVDYIVSPEGIDIVDQWSSKLKEIWHKKPVNPLKIYYESASLYRKITRIIYPVCLYYFQRAIYLCAHGQTPINEYIDCYNYRLDRILEITELTWDEAIVPEEMYKRYLQGRFYTPDNINYELRMAWGFDFYKPINTMLLRFERNFGEDYIKDSWLSRCCGEKIV